MFDFQGLHYILPAIIVALTFHEYAHGRVAYAFGDPTAKNAGRLSLNPLKHLDLLGTLLLVFAGFGWAKPVPINPFYFGANRKRKIMLVSLAGPVANILEAVIGAALLSLLLHQAKGYNAVVFYFVQFFSYFVVINCVLAVFLPNHKMDIIFMLDRYGFLILMLLMFLPTILGWFGLPRIDILGKIISIPAGWLVDGIYFLVGLS